MKSKHRIQKIDKDIIVLDNNSTWRVDVFDQSKPMFWSALSDDVELDDSSFQAKMTNLKKNETIKVTRIS